MIEDCISAHLERIASENKLCSSDSEGGKSDGTSDSETDNENDEDYNVKQKKKAPKKETRRKVEYNGKKNFHDMI